MGFFKKLTRAMNPIEQTKKTFKDPGQAAKNALSMGIDPAGSIVRAGKTGDAAPQNARQMIDPGGRVLMPQQQSTPYQRTPYTPRLSPAAQQLYDQMKARTAARDAARTQGQATQGVGMQAPQNFAAGARTPTTRMIGNAINQVQQLPPGQTAPMTGVSGPQPGMRIPGAPARAGAMAMADGGMVGGDSDCETYENKAFTLKPNGKPY